MTLKNKKVTPFFFFWKRKKITVGALGVLDVTKFGFPRSEENLIFAAMPNLFEKTNSFVPPAQKEQNINPHPRTVSPVKVVKPEEIKAKQAAQSIAPAAIETRIAELKKEDPPADPVLVAESQKEIDLSEFMQSEPKSAVDVLKEAKDGAPADAPKKRGRKKKEA